MPDREKVIRGLECCMKWTGEPNTATCHCSDCSYTNMDVFGERCLIDLINDALALLNEQDETINVLTNTTRQLNQHIKDLSEYMTPYGKVKDVKAYAELLKEQEAVVPKSKVRHGANAQIQHFCGNCMKMLHGKPKYCSECGKAVKWK